ncbi:glycoside hydrolase/deacetylase [Basidiobolus meristosporus CBS 931.73]|uniref:Glycoside hydrolase/deacetylase n=1 Tax=Basidiobolus meristosporus CBS 931.73 TaxID=1314790 RepID=A0A1Y1XTY2_9FUNG|nr:glycoside hydrolase/deacetylase [Basidiobolus meristosporus CBS 931.73]|eukprot:ORX89227.1 glycoside hydrolase/deacetylase [Basidiobolus meristosporus CBS 931.73]
MGSILAGYVAAQDAGATVITKCEKPGVFGLTFDDGPGPNTGDLLAILKEKDVKATFFVLGVQANNTALTKYLKQAYDEGHQIASHTYNHTSLNTLSQEQINSQMVTTEAAIKAVIGAAPAYMRPPYGDCNAACQTVMNGLNLKIITWNVDSNDWQYVNNSTEVQEKLVTNVEDKLNAGNSQVDSWISLQHDIHKFSIDRTARIIDFIKSKGYRFETVADCLNNKWPMYKDGVPNNGTPPPAPSSAATASTSAGTGAATKAPATPAAPSSTPTSLANASVNKNAAGRNAAPFTLALLPVAAWVASQF